MRSITVSSVIIYILGSAAQTSAWTARIGDFFALEPIGGNLGCAAAAKVFNGNEANEFARITQSSPIDGCPAPELRYCNRWGGCPRVFNFAQQGTAPFSIEVQADNSDGTIRVKGSAVNGGTQVVNCGKEYKEDRIDNNLIKYRWIWKCNFN